MTAAPERPRAVHDGFRSPVLEVLADAIERNVAVARSRTSSRMLAVVKADGYGHGAETVARAAVAAGAEWLGTTSLSDAVALRAAGFTVPILSWLNSDGVDAEIAFVERIDIAVGSVDELTALLARASSEVRVHLNLDTGMAREGCGSSEWGDLIEEARKAQRRGSIRVVGLMGQLPLADRADPAVNASAVARMHEARRALAVAGFESPIVHLAATSATLTDPATHFDMVRFGAGLVGIDPSGTTELYGASRLTAPIVHSTAVDAGTPVGYDGSWVSGESTRLNVLPIGYADGIPREISPAASVEIRGRRYPVVGRVSMDQIVVSTGRDCFSYGTPATVFGPDGGAVPTVRDWADWAGTIPHRIVTGIGSRVRRNAIWHDA